MGEAKRRADLGPTRKIHFEAYELSDLVLYLVKEAEKPSGKKLTREQRLAFRVALDQIDVIDVWHRVKKAGGQMRPDDAPKGGVFEVTVESIDVLLANLLAEMDFRDTLNLGGIEEKLLDAKVGVYELPPPEEVKPVAEGTALTVDEAQAEVPAAPDPSPAPPPEAAPQAAE
jgi:hypothetical protein